MCELLFIKDIITEIFIPDTGWRRVIGFKHRSLDPQYKCPSYPMNRNLAGPHSTFGRFGEQKCAYLKANNEAINYISHFLCNSPNVT
jgi:hypothetical protein